MSKVVELLCKTANQSTTCRARQFIMINGIFLSFVNLFQLIISKKISLRLFNNFYRLFGQVALIPTDSVTIF